MVSLLIVITSLRFGCQDPQLMVHAIRCAMRHVRSTLSKDELYTFLLRLRRWQNELGNPHAGLDQFREWLQIRVPAGSRYCN